MTLEFLDQINKEGISDQKKKEKKITIELYKFQLI